MTDTTIYDTINNLEDLIFIGGTDKVLTFTAYQTDGINLLDVISGSVTWFLCSYGEFSHNVLEIAGVITGDHTFTVTIPAASTLALSGKFIQQVSIIDFSGNTFRPGQGTVIISPAIPT
jgi:hypothetical protein